MMHPQSSVPALSGVHVLRVAIEGITPNPWRRLAVPSDLTLADLHEVLQLAFGWYNSHLYQFVLKGGGRVRYASDPMFGLDEGLNAHELRLGEVCPAAPGSLVYEYDVEDQWVHDIEVMAILPAKSSGAVPVCEAGARNGPMEDCGGAGGHMELVGALDDPENADPEMLAWAEGYDPEAFAPAELNRLLADWAAERRRQMADGIAWRRSGLLWELPSISPEHRGPAKARTAGRITASRPEGK